MVDSSRSSSIEFLNSQVEVERVARFVGEAGADRALDYALAVCHREGLSNASVGLFSEATVASEPTLVGRQIGNRIEFNPEIAEMSEGLDQLDILHEVAHLLNHRAGRRGHGSDFAAVYIDLVQRYIGVGVGLILGYELHTAGQKTSSGFPSR